jgi:membrane-bound ClpP family serine protease
MEAGILACGSSSLRRGDGPGWRPHGISAAWKRRCRCAAILSVCALALLLGAGQDAPRRILAIDATNVVHPITVEMITHGLEQAKQQEAVAVFIRLDVRGGMLDSARQIVEKIVASPVPVVT